VRRFVFCALVLSCKTSFDFVPVTAVETHRAAVELESRNAVRFADARGHVHASSEAVDVYVRGEDVSQQHLTDIVHTPLSPNATYEVGIQKRVPDGGKIAGWTLGVTLASALVAGNIACFGTDVCADVTKAIVGIGDGIVSLAVVGFAIVFIAAITRAGGD
jgi:hypothetical protein